MNTSNLEQANQLLAESQKLYQKGINALKAGEDPKEVQRKYSIAASEKLDKALEFFGG